MGKKRQKYCIIILLLIELLIFSLSSFRIWQKEEYKGQLLMFQTETGIMSEQLAVPKGIYRVSVKYESEGNGALLQMTAGETGVYSLYADRIELKPGENEADFCIWVNHDVTDLTAVIETDGSFSVHEISLRTAENSNRYEVFTLAVKLLFLNLAAVIFYLVKKRAKCGYALTGIFIIGMAASAGVFTEYMLYGHDVIFHLLRIEGIKDGLLSGSFPVRIQPNWCNGWGYGVSVMYGDLLLYMPAVLRLLGVTMQDAYKCYVVAINLLTAGVAYYAFYKMAGNKTIALFGSRLYTLAPYRLSCLYIRAAVGEYSAMLFLPLAALCFWYALEKEPEKTITGTRLAVPVIGFSGLIQTHVITCYMAAGFIVLFCLLQGKKLYQKRAFSYLGKTALITFALNAWFILPLLSFMGEGFRFTGEKIMTTDFQKLGANPAELFSVYWTGTLGGGWTEIRSIANKFPKPVGTAFVVMLVLGLLLYWKKEKCREGEKKATFAGSFFILSVFMASTVFPYYALYQMLPLLGNLLYKVQFPYRFLTMAVLFGGIYSVLLMKEAAVDFGRKTAAVIMVGIGILAAWQGLQLTDSVLYSGNMMLAYDSEVLDTNTVIGGEYLYEGTWTGITEQIQEPLGNDVLIESFQKNYNRMEIACAARSEEAYLEIPMFYYPGYVAYDLQESKVHFQVERNADGRIKVLLPEDYQGTLVVAFEEPLLFKAAELISVTTLLGLGYLAMRKREKLWRKQRASV